MIIKYTQYEEGPPLALDYDEESELSVTAIDGEGLWFGRICEVLRAIAIALAEQPGNHPGAREYFTDDGMHRSTAKAIWLQLRQSVIEDDNWEKPRQPVDDLEK